MIANHFNFFDFSLELFVFCLVLFIFDASCYTCSVGFRFLARDRSSGDRLWRHLWMKEGRRDVGHYGSALTL